jgi:hypothetical protein
LSWHPDHLSLLSSVYWRLFPRACMSSCIYMVWCLINYWENSTLYPFLFHTVYVLIFACVISSK